eukprot:gene3494-1875_t
MVYIGSVSKEYGSDVCNVLPAYHSITGCDTTSYPYGIGKIKPFKKMLSHNKVNLLSKFGDSLASVEDLNDARIFMQTILYAGKSEESLIQTRSKMFEKQKTKSSLQLLPDPNSLDQHLKRADLQTFIWRKCLLHNVNYVSAEGRGWVSTEDGPKPLWLAVNKDEQEKHERSDSDSQTEQSDASFFAVSESESDSDSSDH